MTRVSVPLPQSLTQPHMMYSDEPGRGAARRLPGCKCRIREALQSVLTHERPNYPLVGLLNPGRCAKLAIVADRSYYAPSRRVARAQPNRARMRTLRLAARGYILAVAQPSRSKLAPGLRGASPAAATYEVARVGWCSSQAGFLPADGRTQPDTRVLQRPGWTGVGFDWSGVRGVTAVGGDLGAVGQRGRRDPFGRGYRAGRGASDADGRGGQALGGEGRPGERGFVVESE
jgi:hypothetical protein